MTYRLLPPLWFLPLPSRHLTGTQAKPTLTGVTALSIWNNRLVIGVSRRADRSNHKARRYAASLIISVLTLATFLTAAHLSAAQAQTSTPIRATFFYPWYPESWYPTSHFTPTLGAPYNSSDPSVLSYQVAAMEYAHINVAIASWWGQGTPTDNRIPLLLAATENSPLKWALYYEPSPGTQASDLSYIYSKYASNPSYEHVNGKPVLFVYSRSVASCADTANWVALNAGRFYLDLQVFEGYQNCAIQPDQWHQYAPASRTDEQSGHSYSISPGYWKYNSATPLLARDPTAFTQAVQAMVASGEPWQLITTWNEWGEGTAVEDAIQWQTADNYGQYVDILHNAGPSSATPSPATPTASSSGGTVTNSAYTALPPVRLLDTRLSHQTLAADSGLNLTVTGNGVPINATAVALNVTVTNTTAASFLTAYPAGQARPLSSNLNWGPGETVPNLVVIPIGTNGQVTFYNANGNADVVVDLEGYFSPEVSTSTAGSYVPISPARITDTRPGSGQPNAGKTLAGGSILNVQVAGKGGVPESGITAALLNVTVTDTTSPSFLTIYPYGSPLPTASNLNWVPGDTVANRVVVPIGPNGQISIYNQTGSTDVVVDVNGYFTDGSSTHTNASLFVPLSPTRVLDTRLSHNPLGGQSTLIQQMSGVSGIPFDATAVLSNVTATDTSAASYLTVYPTGAQPNTSDLNWSPGQTVPNLAIVGLSSSGSISVFNANGSVDVVIDVFGYFTPISTVSPTPTPTTTPSPTPTPIPTPTPTPTPTSSPSPPHVMVIMEENQGYAATLGSCGSGSPDPYLCSLASTYASATAWYGVEHPSQPNYVDIVSGGNQGCTSDFCVPASAYSVPDLGAQLSSAGIPWTAYMESMPSACYAGNQSGEYVLKHNPFVVFQADMPPNVCHIQPYPGATGLVSALDAAGAPDFVWITPNLMDDMHDGTIQQGDQWLQANLAGVLTSPWFQDNGTVIITMDEGTDDSGCCGVASGGQIPMVVISSNSSGRGNIALTGDHFGTLRSIEEAYGLSLLGAAANSANGDVSSLFG
jgi:hypothetical protein